MNSLGLETHISHTRIGVDTKHNMAYFVNHDINHVDEPYFKVYNHHIYHQATHVARISFLLPRYSPYRSESDKQSWKMKNTEVQFMINYLSTSSRFLNMSFFQYAMYLWNRELGFFDTPSSMQYASPLQEYYIGFYDTEDSLKHLSYLPSTLGMPDYSLL